MENLRELTVTVNTSTCKYWEQDDGTHHRPGVCCVVSGFDSSDVKIISESEWKWTKPAPLLYSCQDCQQEIHENMQAIQCRIGCGFWFHRACSGLTEKAFLLLVEQGNIVRWICHHCCKQWKERILVILTSDYFQLLFNLWLISVGVFHKTILFR